MTEFPSAMGNRCEQASLGRSHNPEVAGSNPAPATGKAPETGLFCSRCGSRLSARCMPRLVVTGCFERECARAGQPDAPRRPSARSTRIILVFPMAHDAIDIVSSPRTTPRRSSRSPCERGGPSSPRFGRFWGTRSSYACIPTGGLARRRPSARSVRTTSATSTSQLLALDPSASSPLR